MRWISAVLITVVLAGCGSSAAGSSPSTTDDGRSHLPMALCTGVGTVDPTRPYTVVPTPGYTLGPCAEQR